MLVFGLVVGTDKTIYDDSLNVFTSARFIGAIPVHDHFESEIWSKRSVISFALARRGWCESTTTGDDSMVVEVAGYLWETYPEHAGR